MTWCIILYLVYNEKKNLQVKTFFYIVLIVDYQLLIFNNIKLIFGQTFNILISKHSENIEQNQRQVIKSMSWSTICAMLTRDFHTPVWAVMSHGEGGSILVQMTTGIIYHIVRYGQRKYIIKEAAMSSPSFTLFEKKMDAPWATSSG